MNLALIHSLLLYRVNCKTLWISLLILLSGEVPRVRPEWYLPGRRRVRHPCLHLQAVVRGPQLHRWARKCWPLVKHSSGLYCVSFGGVAYLTLLSFSHCRPLRTGDWSGLWRERAVPDFCRNGQESQILQSVKMDEFKMKRGGTTERRIESSLYPGHWLGIDL